MLYRILKLAARLAIRIYCRKLVINNRSWLQQKGPLLLACNHPNSFLDSVIIDTIFNAPVWSLARGDAFKKPFYARLLRKLYILPVYRTSEGVENLSENYKTFNDCIRLFRQNGIITIFSEGKCINEWHLRPLKKGTARLAVQAWQENIPLTVLPVAINYSSFTRFGKNIFISFGTPITAASIDLQAADGLRNASFNKLLQQELQQGVLEIAKDDRTRQQQLLTIPVPFWKKILLFLPALLGWLLHAPLYYPVKSFVWKRTRDNDHYDSVMVGMLILLYPLYIVLLVTVLALLTHFIWGMVIFLLLPFTAWSAVQLKKQ